MGTHRTRHYGAYNTLDEALAKRNKLLIELLENKEDDLNGK